MKIIFAHGLASSGRYKMASSLRILLRPAEVIAPDLPLEPGLAVELLSSLCEKENPDLVIGLSLGGFMVQKLRGRRRMLVNPDLHPSRLLRPMKGEREYLSPREDGAKTFTITEDVCREYERMEEHQYELLDPEFVTGMFADADEMVNCQAEFSKYYPGRAVSYPGGHLPDYPQIKTYFVPEILQLVK